MLVVPGDGQLPSTRELHYSIIPPPSPKDMMELIIPPIPSHKDKDRIVAHYPSVLSTGEDMSLTRTIVQ